MSALWAIFGVTILVLLALVAYVVWLNYLDRASENTIGRSFDKYAGRGEYESRGYRFRDQGEEDDGDA